MMLDAFSQVRCAIASSAVASLGLFGAPQADSAPLPEASVRVSGGSLVEPGLERPYLFMQDPSLPAPGHVILSAGLGSVTRTGETRPIGAGPLLPTAGAEVGLFSRLAAYVEGTFASNETGSEPPATNAAFEVGAHALLTAPGAQNLRLAVQVALGRDLSAAGLVRANAALAWDIDRIRLATSITGAHDFQASADSIDVSGTAAASVLLPLNLRFGGELVTQDLEELGANDGAEGGVSAFAGPTLGWTWDHRFEIVVGPAFGLTATTPRVLARGTASILF